MAEYTKDIYGVQQQIADEQAAQEQGYITDAVNLASVKRAGMMYHAAGIGRRQGDAYAGLGRMLTGEEEAVDPRMARMQKLESIMEQVPEPDTYDEYIQLAGLMNQAGLFGEAQEAMKMANEIKSSQPAKSNAWKEYTDMTSNPTPEGFQIWYDKYKVTSTGKGGYKEFKTEDADGNDIIEYYETGANGLIVPNSKPVFTRLTDKTSSTITDPKKIAL